MHSFVIQATGYDNKASLISLIRKYLWSCYDSALIRMRGENYVILFNLKSFIRGIDVSMSFDKQSRQYTVSAKGEVRKRVFFHEKQANMAYSNGIAERGESLGKSYFLNRIKFESNDQVIDCGANVGDLYLWFENKNLDINYIGFEPSPKEFECLSQNIKGQQCINVGLWDTTGELDFYVSSQYGDSSIIRPAIYDEIIPIRVATLIDFVNKPVKLLKLEAEGAEPEILEGLGDKLNLIHYISADLGYERGLKNESMTFPP